MDNRTAQDIATLEARLVKDNAKLEILPVDLSCTTKGFLVAVVILDPQDKEIQIAEATGATITDALEYLGRHWLADAPTYLD